MLFFIGHAELELDSTARLLGSANLAHLYLYALSGACSFGLSGLKKIDVVGDLRGSVLAFLFFLVIT
jgi:hypothetical protein